MTFKFQVLLPNVNDHNKSMSIITPYLAFNNEKVSWESNLQSKAKCFDPYYFFDQFQSNCSTRFFANRKLFIFCSKLLMHFFLSNFFFLFSFSWVCQRRFNDGWFWELNLLQLVDGNDSSLSWIKNIQIIELTKLATAKFKISVLGHCHQNCLIFFIV